ncbi:MAG: METTL5 family protein [Methanobrevibacter boviskoreani]|jgi:putative methylase|uniref:METTL5 family protein n=1 Tax=Methanobrevibacter boviskoreani TaxID=1348249 RepID=UPI00059522E5|nr:METTL5 family protein [Methanobrevibacter boviskoreani]MCI6774531.1 METTL5 family protein [Methanobrevibacter boviskoreani]MCI6930000.1 METTL5 family protein [Methanobrevibacter boviskoreani]MDD6256403.1 METTL5 family protein [Methanobrevibacter boviskoreani]MDY5614048.1 METTL5 family protein [Methanobrevibacter boviskoreani]
MIKITKKKHLEMILQNIPSHPNPKVEFEQYSTPSSIASDVLWNAYTLGDIYNMDIVDLGCGTGIFSIGSIFLGANSVLGIDIDDESLEMAQNVSKHIGISTEKMDSLHFFQGNVNNLKKIKDLDISGFSNDKVDTLIQNPPFGSQEKAKNGADRRFIDFACENSEVIYSFHMASTHDFIVNYFEDLGAKITHEFYYNFPLKKIYKFHTQESRNVGVIVFRVETF